MHTNKQLLLLILILHFMFVSIARILQGIGFAGVLIKYLKNCEPNGQNLYKYNVTIKTINKSQYLNGVILVLEPFDNNLKISAGIEMLTGKDYIYLFTIRENKACDTLHKFLGEFVYDIERGMGHTPRACPITKNTYHLYNLPIDASKITTASNFPFGSLRITARLLDKKNHVVNCIESVVENNILHL